MLRNSDFKVYIMYQCVFFAIACDDGAVGRANHSACLVAENKDSLDSVDDNNFRAKKLTICSKHFNFFKWISEARFVQSSKPTCRQNSNMLDFN